MDADPEADPPWLATEYVEGLDLRRHVDSHGPLPVPLTASLCATLAEALATVHKQGLLHRDLKPANVLLGPNGPKIIDFGLAVFAESSVSLTAPNTIVGTPSCMPPEQANGERPLTPAVDVYALGAVLLFAASGNLPYRADNLHVLFHQVVDPTVAPDLSGAPRELVPLLTAMLAHEARDRPPLDDVVRQCRALIEAQGLKVAQARRQLTTYTAAPAHALDELLGAPKAEGGSPDAPGIGHRPGRRLARPPEVTGTTSLRPSQPRSDAARGSGAAAPGHQRQSGGRRDRARTACRAQARITAQRLHEAYAARRQADHRRQPGGTRMACAARRTRRERPGPGIPA